MKKLITEERILDTGKFTKRITMVAIGAQFVVSILGGNLSGFIE